MKEIIIKVDTDKQGIMGIDIPKELNPLQVCIIFNTISNKLLSQVTVEEDEKKIIEPKRKIVA